MEQLTVRALSRETASVLDRVVRGETIEVTRGKQVVARLEPVRKQDDRTLRRAAHLQWLEEARRSRRRSKVDPVDELRSERGHRDDLR